MNKKNPQAAAPLEPQEACPVPVNTGPDRSCSCGSRHDVWHQLCFRCLGPQHAQDGLTANPACAGCAVLDPMERLLRADFFRAPREELEDSDGGGEEEDIAPPRERRRFSLPDSPPEKTAEKTASRSTVTPASWRGRPRSRDQVFSRAAQSFPAGEANVTDAELVRPGQSRDVAMTIAGSLSPRRVWRRQRRWHAHSTHLPHTSDSGSRRGIFCEINRTMTSDLTCLTPEFEDAESLLEGNKDATTISIEDAGHRSQTQRRPAGTTFGEEEDDSLANDDKTELLSDQKKSAPFWSFDYYQTLFDVDTYQVKERIIGSLLPWPGKNFVRHYIRSNPDLYGPFWICATLVFAIAISGNISNFLVHSGQPKYKYVPEFRKVTIAATAIFSYAWLVPLALWGLLVWRNTKVMNLVSYSFLEIVCAYGYSLAIYIPAVVLWIVPSEGVRWCSIVVALCLSGSVLVLTFWPAVRDDQRRVALAIMSVIVVLHILLAVGCKEYFFSTPEADHPKLSSLTTAVKVSSVTKAH